MSETDLVSPFRINAEQSRVPMPFPKGVSGNPGGRPKENPEVREMAREHTPLAISRLVHWCQSDDPRASVAASTALLDRAYGKPRQTQEFDVADGGKLTVQIVRFSDKAKSETEAVEDVG